MEATRTIQEGDAIYSDDFRPQLLVKRGEEIAVYARGGGIQVRTIARARQDGARGELIGVESLEAKEPFEAVVTGPREAVVFTASAAPARRESGRATVPQIAAEIERPMYQSISNTTDCESRAAGRIGARAWPVRPDRPVRSSLRKAAC